MRGLGIVACSVGALLVGCGGGKKPVEKPVEDDRPKVVAKKPETEADRERKRLEQAHAIIPEGSSCLPPSLKDENAPRLELGAAGKEALVCAIDQDRDRLLGSVGCWKVDLTSGKLEYRSPMALPGRGFSVKLDGACARGFCLPSAPDNDIVHMAYNLDNTKVAVAAGDEVHIFAVEGKAHESSFSIRGESGVTNTPSAVHFVGDAILVEGKDDGPHAAVWVFKTDGTQVGPITMLGAKDAKPLSTHHGSFSILDKTRVAVGYRGMETLNTFDVTTGARAKLVRKVPKLACKPAELDAYWVDGDKVTDKCRASIEKAAGHLKGGTVVAGGKSLLILLRGNRLGELAVVDPKSLAEKSVLKMPWCDAEGGGDDAAAADAPKKKATTRGAVQAESADPQEGGE